MGYVLAVALLYFAGLFHDRSCRVSFGAVFLLFWLGVVVVILLAVVAPHLYPPYPIGW